MLSSYKFFSIYRGVQLHFTSSYDYFKYEGLSKGISKDNFDDRKDRHRFVYWGEKLYNEDDALKFCVFNFLNKKDWLYSSFAEANEVYNSKLGLYSSFNYKIKQDTSYIISVQIERNSDLKTLLNETPNGNKPPILQMYLNGKINIETVCLLNRIHKFLDGWEINYSNDPFLSEELFKIKKYEQFVVVFNKRK